MGRYETRKRGPKRGFGQNFARHGEVFDTNYEIFRGTLIFFPPKSTFRGEGKNENPKIFDLNKVKNKVKNKKGTLLKEKSNWDFWSCSGCIEVS